MRLSAGLIFMLGILAFGLSVLAGGQLWAVSGSLALGGVGGAGVLLVLILGMRWFVRRARADLRIRFLGEPREDPDMGDFIEVATDDARRETISRNVDNRPDRAAASVRSLLSRGGDAAS